MAAPSTRDRFIQTALEAIADEGGSLDVNLRQIARRMGCAHTNVYNYFDSFGDLLWAAFRRGLQTYAERLIRGLDVSLDAREYLRRVIANLAAFPQEQPGLYRFIGSDPLVIDEVPEDVMVQVTQMKRWLAMACEAAAGPGVDPDGAREAADIMLAYIDGETLNIINGRVVPDEDPAARVEANAMRIFGLLTGSARAGLGQASRLQPPDPRLVFATGSRDVEGG